MATVAEPTTALDLADEFRHGRTTCRPFELWRFANVEAGSDSARRVLFRHAMIHAGYLLTRKGWPYKRCPMCHRGLSR